MEVNQDTQENNSQDTPQENTSKYTVVRNEKGQIISGTANPKGKPKGARHFTTLFREAVARIAEGNEVSDDIIMVRAVVEKAKKGDLNAVDRVIDRIDGKAQQTIDLNADVSIDEGLTKEQKEALLSLLK